MRTLPREYQRWVVGQYVPFAIATRWHGLVMERLLRCALTRPYRSAPRDWQRLAVERLLRSHILVNSRKACHETDRPSNRSEQSEDQVETRWGDCGKRNEQNGHGERQAKYANRDRIRRTGCILSAIEIRGLLVVDHRFVSPRANPVSAGNPPSILYDYARPRSLQECRGCITCRTSVRGGLEVSSSSRVGRIFPSSKSITSLKYAK